MFASIVEFRLNPIFKEEFIENWFEYISLLKELKVINEAQLHAETPITLISYVQWKERSFFESHLLRPKGQIKDSLQRLEENCNNVKILHRMYIIASDL